MKKVLVFICIAGLIFACGCTGYREIERGYLVTAVGFKKQSDKTEIVLETLLPNDTAENIKETEILSGAGTNFSYAYKNLQNSLVKALYFEQCGVVAVDGTFSPDEIATILEFCHNLPSFNIGVYVIKTDNINSLFENGGTAGYDIIGLIKNKTENQGDIFSNQLYQIERDMSKEKTISLPEINVINKKFVLETK